jgi:hypothetical protein
MDKTLKDSYLDMQVNATDKKSSSTPHLTDKQEESHDSRSNRDLPDLFMEMDFNRDGSQDELRPRTSSTGSSKDFRSRTSSTGSKEFRSRTSSFGFGENRQRTASWGKKDKKEKISRLASLVPWSSDRHGDGHRPRTATICQDSLRPRTSSFGSADMRPRSSSQGNARFKERFKNIKASQESLKRKVTSTESVSSTTSSDYLDMHPKPGSSPSGKRDSESEYISMSMERVPERLGASPLVRESIDEGYMAMDLAHNQVTHSARPKTGKRPSGSKGSSSESLSSSSQSSMDTKPVTKLTGQEYSEMDFSSAQPDSYVMYAPGAPKEKLSKSMEKVTSPIRCDVPQLSEPTPAPPHPWMHSKH